MFYESISNGLLFFYSSAHEHQYLLDYFRHELWRVRTPAKNSRDAKVLIAGRTDHYGPIRIVEIELPGISRRLHDDEEDDR